MTRYTICFDEEKEADLLRWMDAQINKSMSLKALVERSIAQEGYNDIFQLAWKQNIYNSIQMPNAPIQASLENHAQQPKRKRGRPRKNTSSLPDSTPVMQETAKQKEEHIQVHPVLTTEPDIQQPPDIALSSANNSAAISVSEIPAEQNKEYISNIQSAIPEDQFMKSEKENMEIENDGYQRPGNVNFDMAKFFG